MTFINYSESIGQIVQALAVNVTGNLESALILIFILLFLILTTFKVPIDWILLMLLPFVLIMMAFNSALVGLGLLILFFLSIIFAVRFFL